MENETKNNKVKHWAIIIGLFAAVIGAEIINIYAVEKVYDKLEHASWFGGYHGAISAVFTGLASAFTLYLIVLQKEEIHLNEENRRKDGEKREVADRKRDVADFETRFFKIIEMWRQSAENVHISDSYGKRTTVGIAYFTRTLETLNYMAACKLNPFHEHEDNAILENLYSWCFLANISSSKKTVVYVDLNKPEARDSIESVSKYEHLDCADSYIKLFLEILRQISGNIEGDSAQKTYINILTSTMADEELYVLYYLSFTEKWKILRFHMDSLEIAEIASNGLVRDYRIKLIPLNWTSADFKHPSKS